MKKPAKTSTLPVVAPSTGLALQRAKSLVKLTKSVLGDQHAVVPPDAWIAELLEWADAEGIPEHHLKEGHEDKPENYSGLPRDKQKILALKHFHTDYMNTKLSNLHPSIGNLTNLIDLNLMCAGLSELPDTIGNLTSIKTLNFNCNELSEFPDTMSNLTSLESLELIGNDLLKLPNMIDSFARLKWLNLEGNCLSELPDTVGNLARLEELDLRDNPLSNLPQSLGKLRNLKELCLPPDFILPPQLSHLEPIVNRNLPFGYHIINNIF